MFQSDDIKELITALVAAKKEFKPLRFDKAGNRGMKYASIAAINEATKDALLKHGLTLDQFEIYDQAIDKTILKTILTHVSGQWRANHALLIAEKSQAIANANQAYGAAISYARRYSLASMLNLAADENDVDEHEYEAEPAKPRQPSSREVILGRIKEGLKQINDPEYLYAFMQRYTKRGSYHFDDVQYIAGDKLDGALQDVATRFKQKAIEG